MPVRNRFVTCFVAWIALDLACELVELSELVSSQVTFDRLALLPWKFYWDELSYQVDEYPNATVSLRVRTVSMSEEWIGV